jgi:hypothetical protein
MAGNLSDIINIVISTASAQILQAGFGVPLIAAYHTKYTDRVRTYVNPADLLLDGFLTTEPVYLAASALVAQTPRPTQFKVGRLANAPTLKFVLVPTVSDSTVYKLTVNGLVAQFTSGVGATLAQITAGLKAAFDALAQPLTTVDSGTTLTATANVAGAFHSVYVDDETKLTITQTHVDPGSAADLDAIKLVDNTWYGLLGLYNSKAVVLAMAAWSETNKKLFIAQTQDGDCLTASTTDVMSATNLAAYNYTSVWYHRIYNQFADSALDGAVLPFVPGSETWKFKTLAGISADGLNTNQKTNMQNKKGNFYETIAGINITENGQCASGQFIDITRGVDDLQADMQTRIFARLATVKKVPYTDKGIAIIEGEMRASLQSRVERGLLSDSPAPVVQVPLAANMTQVDRGNRNLPNMNFFATLAGAVHTVRIQGTVSV